MTRKRNSLFGKGRPRLRGTPFVAPVSAPVSRRGRALPAKALAKADKESESERLERKLSDSQLEAKLRRHYSGGGNLREFLAANPGVSKVQFKRCAAKVNHNPADAAADVYHDAGPFYPALRKSRKKNPSKSEWEYLVAHGWRRVETGSRERGKAQPYWPAGRWLKEGISGKFTISQAIARQRREAKHNNPSSAAAEVYEEFHGRPSEEVVTVKEKIHYHEHLAALGELRTLIVQARDGARVTLTRFKKAILCTNEAKNQMFVRGGDQSVDLKSFGIRTAHEIETLGRVVELAYFTTKDHLGDEGGTALYFHVAGETNENGKRKMAGWGPDLIYHTVDERLEFSGGSYMIRAEGVDK